MADPFSERPLRVVKQTGSHKSHKIVSLGENGGNLPVPLIILGLLPNMYGLTLNQVSCEVGTVR